MKTKEINKSVFLQLDDLMQFQYLVRGISFLKRGQLKTLLAGRHGSVLRGRGMDFEEVRKYVSGDDIRNIDWKVTARTKTTHTKVFTEEREYPAMLLVDLSRSMFFGSQKNMKSVVAAKLAALSAFTVVNKGDRIGGVVFNDNGIDIVKPKRDKRAILHLFEKLVNRNNELAEIPFEKSINDKITKIMGRVNKFVTHDYLVIVISDFKRFDMDNIKPLINMSKHNDVVVFRVYDPLEEDLQTETYTLSDGAKSITVDTKNTKTRSVINSSYEQQNKKLSDLLGSYRIPVISVNTIDPVEEQVRNLLKMKR